MFAGGNKYLKVNKKRAARSSVCVCALILELENKELRLTHPDLWTKETRGKIGLLRKNESKEYSTGASGRRGAKV
jgi:hypothetical protein